MAIWEEVSLGTIRKSIDQWKSRPRAVVEAASTRPHQSHFLTKRPAQKYVLHTMIQECVVLNFENKQSNGLKLTHSTANRVRKTHAKIQACNLHTYSKILH